MKEKRFWRIALPIGIVLWTMAIWGQSLLPAPISSGISKAVVQDLAWVWQDKPPLAVGDTVVSVTFVVRKLAHLVEFALLGVLWSACACVYRRRLLWVWGLLIGPMDEGLQFLVPGRAPILRDVFIDTVGYLCACGLLLGITHLLYKKKNKDLHFWKTRATIDEHQMPV